MRGINRRCPGCAEVEVFVTSGQRGKVISLLSGARAHATGKVYLFYKLVSTGSRISSERSQFGEVMVIFTYVTYGQTLPTVDKYTCTFLALGQF